MSTRTRSIFRIVVVALSATVIFANALMATPPLGGIPTVPERPGVPSTPPGGEGGFDWQGLAEGVLRGMQQQPPPGRRPVTPTIPSRPSPSFRIPLRPPMQPSYPQPSHPQPSYPQPSHPQPSYPQPSYPPPTYSEPQYVPVPSPQPPLAEPQRTAPLTPNVIAEPEQKVVPSVPQQLSPWQDRVWEASLREMNCYGNELQQKTLEAFSSFRGAMGKTGGKGTPLFDQLEQTQIMLQQGASWRNLEPLMQQVLQQNRASLTGPLSEKWQTVMRLAMVREAFRVAASGVPRARGGPLGILAIPTGIIWVVYDPLLPVGSGLYVSERLMVCGGGPGTELRLVSTTAAEGLGLPVAPGKPEPDISEEEALAAADAIIIRNLKDAATSVHYVLNGRFKYSIEPGHAQKLDANKDWTVEFDRGDGSGAARYALTKGTYEFRIVSGHWDLVRVTYRVNLDNRDGKQDFRYLLKNEVVTVKAGETQELESSEPIVLSFDRGEGTGKPAHKNLNKSGTYKIAVDTDTNYLDLFATESS